MLRPDTSGKLRRQVSRSPHGDGGTGEPTGRKHPNPYGTPHAHTLAGLHAKFQATSAETQKRLATFKRQEALRGHVVLKHMTLKHCMTPESQAMKRQMAPKHPRRFMQLFSIIWLRSFTGLPGFPHSVCWSCGLAAHVFDFTRLLGQPNASAVGLSSFICLSNFAQAATCVDQPPPASSKPWPDSPGPRLLLIYGR